MKIERTEIERLLVLAELRPQESYAVHGLEVIALCRAWLALDCAPVVSITCRHTTFGHGDYGSQWVIGDSYNPPPIEAMKYVKYRLAPVLEDSP